MATDPTNSTLEESSLSPPPVLATPPQTPQLRIDTPIPKPEEAETTAITTSASSDNHPSDTSSIAILTQLLTSRHSARVYLRDPVPPSLLHRALSLAQLSPSNSNTQPWRLYIATGSTLSSLSAALLASASNPSATPPVPPLPPQFSPYRRELGRELYGRAWGLSRDDEAGRLAAVRRNFDFWGASVGVVVTMDRDLERWDALGVGMYLQSLMLALEAQGLSSCVMVSTAAHPDACRSALPIPDTERILCGIAIGFEDVVSERGARVNRLKRNRREVEESVLFFD